MVVTARAPVRHAVEMRRMIVRYGIFANGVDQEAIPNAGVPSKNACT
jgi:hypothetical protein